MSSQTTQFILYAFLSGILPALLWLWFWLKEDCHPEPKKRIFWTFLAGAAVIPPVFLVQFAFLKIFIRFNLATLNYYPLFLIFIFAGIEEYFKYFAAKKAALEKKDFDEPIDALVYLITAALGFAALENMFFIFKEFSDDGFAAGLFSGNLRFLGASLVHIISSGVIGTSIAFSFFHPVKNMPLWKRFKMNHTQDAGIEISNEVRREHQKRNIFAGFILATLLHSFFNYFIISREENIFKIFLVVWIFAVIIIYIFERSKN